MNESALDHVKELCQHADFDHKNPNKTYALIGGFVHGNAVMFHAEDGSDSEDEGLQRVRACCQHVK